LQEQREGNGEGRRGSEPGPYYTNAARTAPLAATNAALVIAYLYPRPPEVVIALAAAPLPARGRRICRMAIIPRARASLADSGDY
jgi:hypothetical protein